MRYAPQYLQSAVTIIGQYKGEIPLAAFLKQYFAQHKKFGSKDRKWIAHLCYTYFRLGHAIINEPVEIRMRVALFLCQPAPGEWASLFDENWLLNWQDDIDARINFVTAEYPVFTLSSVFPWTEELDPNIDVAAFIRALLVQPDMFIRIRPGKENFVQKKITAAGISFTQLSEHCLALPNGSKIDEVLETDKDVVIQDLSSQRIKEFLTLIPYPLPLTPKVYDCCAASGGKSILAKDILKEIDLTVSDLRPSIIRNLAGRFERAGIKNYHSFIADLSNHKPQTTNNKLVICDAPCTGSGTWGRTPEQLFFFKHEKIREYASLQQKIVRNVMDSIGEHGYLLYITCSVFKKENEEIAEMIMNEFPLKLVKMETLRGYNDKADSMFAVLFMRED